MTKKVQLKDRLNEAIQARGLRASDLVDRTGIPKGTMSYYMSGKTEPKADRLYKLSQALDVSEAWLLGYDVPMQRSIDQKKNDQLAELVVKMRSDASFFDVVAKLAQVDAAQRETISSLLDGLIGHK